MFTAPVRETLSALAQRHPETIFWADSRRRIGSFTGVIIKSNQFEAVLAAFPGFEGQPDKHTIIEAGRTLAQRSGRPVFVTRAERGILVFGPEEVHSVQGVRVDGPVDPTGAGDSATAAAVLTLAGGGILTEAALLANLVASITVEQLGVTGVARPEQIPARLDMWRTQACFHAGALPPAPPTKGSALGTRQEPSGPWTPILRFASMLTLPVSIDAKLARGRGPRPQQSPETAVSGGGAGQSPRTIKTASAYPSGLVSSRARRRGRVSCRRSPGPAR